VGNGGSVALHPGFSYKSLHDEAVKAGRLPTSQGLFTALQGGTTNFEYVLLALSHATTVGHVLRAPALQAQAAYDEVRTGLIDTVNQVHCAHGQVQQDLVKVAAFAKQFPTVVTLNYDLTLYWAMLDGNDLHGRWFKDGFVNGSAFDPGWERLRAPYGTATGATLVFFGHGSLILGTDLIGSETKVVTGSSIDLLNAIATHWKSGGLAPLFVSEGTASEKLAAIRRSRYLSTVYDHVLTDFKDKNVVAYGLSFATNDQHVLDAIAKEPPARLAVSVYDAAGPNAQAFCHHVLAEVRRVMPSAPRVEFFDSASAGCWNH